MKNEMVNVGYSNFVALDKIVFIIQPDPAPIKRIVQKAREEGMLFDATSGRKTRAVIITSTGQILLSCIHAETIEARISQIGQITEQ